MKANRGVTLASLIVYITVLIVIVSVISRFVGYFNKNMNNIVIQEGTKEQYSKFLAYLSKDVNSDNLIFAKTADSEEDSDYLILKFDDGKEHQYIIKNNNIYYIDTKEPEIKKILLCRNVKTNIQKAFTYENETLTIDFNIEKDNFLNKISLKV